MFIQSLLTSSQLSGDGLEAAGRLGRSLCRLAQCPSVTWHKKTTRQVFDLALYSNLTIVVFVRGVRWIFHDLAHGRRDHSARNKVTVVVHAVQVAAAALPLQVALNGAFATGSPEGMRGKHHSQNQWAPLVP